nr:zinc-ribbon domain-containing protein [Euzebya pacifica]
MRPVWTCSTCGHRWRTLVRNRALPQEGTNGACPPCAGVAAGPLRNLARSRPDLASEWHPTRNGDLTPSTVTPQSARLAWWYCEPHGYAWRAKVAHRYRGGDRCAECVRAEPLPESVAYVRLFST